MELVYKKANCITLTNILLKINSISSMQNSYSEIVRN